MAHSNTSGGDDLSSYRKTNTKRFIFATPEPADPFRKTKGCEANNVSTYTFSFIYNPDSENEHSIVNQGV
ncbi:predicted protein [Botrytis cinerea T4]|uniref:Uncharacterized protein n=1 Tax=Botryotinia fuckeliana (strain T4) TaxID=999810 RepID=G2YGK5_BOTF4|nr:predicted protein [Botrytis cinerea T4]